MTLKIAAMLWMLVNGEPVAQAAFFDPGMCEQVVAKMNDPRMYCQ